jgi:thymidylate synthase (FAD)
MKFVKPQVNLVARPQVVLSGLDNALEDHVGHDEWIDKRFFATEGSGDQGPDAENLIEAMGRLCYDSFGVGGNPNVTRVRGDREQYFNNIIDSGHGSIMEHAQFTFHFKNVSRIFTHELVRHRVGTAMSQESGRYVRPTELRIVQSPHAAKMVKSYHTIEKLYLEEVAKHDWDSMKFSEKKELTSELRRMLPEGAATEIGWSGNIRTLRHVIDLRTSPHAEWEIRSVFEEVARIMHRECRLLFADQTRDDW